MQVVKDNITARRIARSEVTKFEFPDIIPIKISALSASSSCCELSSLKRIPSESVCEEALSLLNKPENKPFQSVAFSSLPGITFNKDALNTLKIVHELRSLRNAVREEENWLSSEHINEEASAIVSSVKNFLFTCSNNLIVFKPSVFVSDLVTLCCNRWVAQQAMFFLSKKLNNIPNRIIFLWDEVKDLNVFYLEALIQQKCNDITKVSNLFFIIHVGVNESKQAFASSPQEEGCHWTLVEVRLQDSQLYYYDTKGWGFSANILNSLKSLLISLKNIHGHRFKCNNIHLAHDPDSKDLFGNHACNTKCMPNFVFQTCSNICGPIILFSCFIALYDYPLWLQITSPLPVNEEPYPFFKLPSQRSFMVKCI